MKEDIKIAIDLSKTVFQLHAAKADGTVLWRRRVRRDEVLSVIGEYEGIEIGMEACGGSHYWGRKFEELGHEVKLIAPQYVKPFVKRGKKNDAADAEAISDAMSRQNIRSIPVKSEWQQELGQVHRAREMLVRHRTALVNQIKGFFHEFGVVLMCSYKKLKERYEELLMKRPDRLGTTMKRTMERLFKHLDEVEEQIGEHEKELKALHKSNDISPRLESIPGVGIITATAVAASFGDNVERFKNGREFAASLGLVPRQHSSGEKRVLGRISKRGDREIRKNLVQGAHSVVLRGAEDTSSRGEWLRSLIERCGKVKAVIAVANKNARIIWSLIKRGECYMDKPPERRRRRANSEGVPCTA